MPTKRVIEQGQTIATLAFEYGFFPDTIWNDAANSELKRKRQNPHILFPGDVVTIPDKRLKEESKPDGKRYTFRRKGVPKMLRIRLADTHGPLKNLGYRIDIDGKLSKGKTDGDGVLQESIPLDARHAKLWLDNSLEYEIALGEMDPIGEVSGVQKRLINLGFLEGPADGQLGPATIEAMKSFQRCEGLTVNGEADEATKQRLVELSDNKGT